MRLLLACFLVLGCDVYSADLLDGGPGNDARVGCPRGLADCDRNGTCESDLMSEGACGSCSNVCAPGETCVAGVLCASGDVRDLDVGPIDASFDSNIDDAGQPDTPIADTGGIDVPADVPPPCYRQPPPRPTVADGSDTSSLVFALRDVVVNQGAGRWEEIGWDLDSQCTDTIDVEFLCTPPGNPFPPFDGPQGVDNTFGDRILGLLSDFEPGFQDLVRAQMLAGNTAVVLLKDWNGEDDDPRVDVQVVRVLGVDRADGNPVPQWDGPRDLWIRSSDSYGGVGGDALLRDEDAYIVNRMIVARFPPRQPLVLPWLNMGNFTIRLSDSLLTGTISADGTRLNELILQGRFAEVDLGNALADTGFCPGGTARNFVDIEISKTMDLRALPGSGGPGATCDAISMAFEYTGWLAEEASIQDPPLPPPVTCLP